MHQQNVPSVDRPGYLRRRTFHRVLIEHRQLSLQPADYSAGETTSTLRDREVIVQDGVGAPSLAFLGPVTGNEQ